MKKAYCSGKKITTGDKIGVEDSNQFPGEGREGVVDVTGFGVTVIGAITVFTAQGGGQFPDGGATGIIQKIYFLVGVVHSLTGDDGAAENIYPLVVGRDDDVHPGEVFAFDDGLTETIGFWGTVYGKDSMEEEGDGVEQVEGFS